jgi:hypothetical protein
MAGAVSLPQNVIQFATRLDAAKYLSNTLKTLRWYARMYPVITVNQMFKGFRHFFQSRVAVLSSVFLIAVLLGLGTLTRGSLAAAWLAFNVPGSTPGFADTLLVTNSLDCVLAGQNPYVVRACDPFGRVYNYPPIWLQLRHLGVTSRSTNLIGIGLAALVIATLVILFRSSGWVSGAIAFVAMFSRPLLFGIERGNTDLLIFSAMVLTLMGLHRMTSRHEEVGRELLIIALSVLKLYPIAMVLLFVRRRTGWLQAGIVAAASGLAILATCLHRLHYVFMNTAAAVWMSFGSFDTFLFFRPYLPAVLNSHVGLGRTFASTVAVVVGVCAALYGASGAKPVRMLLTPFDASTGIGAVAASGLAIFCLTFGLGASYDYHLIFLLGPLGFLVRDLANSSSLRSLPVALLLVAEQLSPYTTHLIPATEEVSRYARNDTIPQSIHPIVFVVACTWLGYSMLAEHRVDTPAIAGRETIVC